MPLKCSIPDIACNNDLVQDIGLEIDRLKLMQKDGNIDGVDIVIAELRKKEYKLKEQKVLSVHANAITEISIKKRGKEVSCWQTRCNGNRPRCFSYEALIEKLYQYYFDGRVITNFSFNNLFEAALENKIITERPKEKTVRDYRDTYKAWIEDGFGKKDIRLIKPSDLNIYMQKKITELAPTKKYFYRFKGVLNLVFDFACDPERMIIDFNPVPKNNAVFAKNFKLSSNKPEDKAFQPQELDLIREHLWNRVNVREYDVYGYAILFSSETGVREGEIPSLKWSDIRSKDIHIHSQQNDEKRDGKRVFYYNEATKNEKGISRDGRYIPITDRIRKILVELKAKQEHLGIDSEWVFCREDGSWITTVSYYRALKRVCKKLEL